MFGTEGREKFLGETGEGGILVKSLFKVEVLQV